MKEKTKRNQIAVISITLALLAGMTGCSAVVGTKQPQKTSSVAVSSSSADNSVYGPSVINGNTHTPLEVICTVPNKSGCTNLSSMVIDGKTLYCIKTKGDNSIAELFRIDQFESASRKVDSWDNTGLYHANGITFANGNLYVATMQPPDPNNSSVAQVWKLSASGAKSEAYKSDKDTIYSISRFVDDTFLVGLEGTNAGKKEYAIATLSNGKVNLTKRFYVDQMKAYGTGQDICFYNGYLYIPTWSGTTGNKILKVKIGKSVTEGKKYEPEEIIEINTTDSSITKLEIESLDADENGKMVVCTNFETTANKDTDTIFRFSI